MPAHPCHSQPSTSTFATLTSLTLTLTLTEAVFPVRPFLEEPIRIDRPRHNFWPYVPMEDPEAGNESSFFQRPDHNFWPYIPVQKPRQDWNVYFDVPRHNFWPFIPVVEPGKNGSRPFPVTPPPVSPTLPPPEKTYDYGEVIYKSILFYEAQRSGWLPEDRKVTWRGHSALEDRGEYGEDLTGGWYDAGDYVKFGLPMAGATSMLLLGLIEFREAYQAMGLLDDMLDCVRWPLDYFIKAHPSQYEFYAMVGDPYVDHTYWGRPEDMTMYRPAYKLTPEAPGSDVIAETAAAMAAGSIAFKDVDKDYSSLLLRHAIELFDFADRYRGLYSDSLPIVQEFYSSSGYNDELAWAAAWLYQATGSKRYLRLAEENYFSYECWSVCWDNKNCLAALLLFKLTGAQTYREDLERTMKSWMPGGSVDYTPSGLAYREPWGPLRYTANIATLALVAAKHGIEPLAYRMWAREQIHYILGDSGRSYIVGFGEDPPMRPHHASSSCPPYPSDCSWSYYTSSYPNPITLYGALVGGPANDDSFYDERDNYYQSEVSCDYNAGMTSAVAGLADLELRQKKLDRLSQHYSGHHVHPSNHKHLSDQTMAPKHNNPPTFSQDSDPKLQLSDSHPDGLFKNLGHRTSPWRIPKQDSQRKSVSPNTFPWRNPKQSHWNGGQNIFSWSNVKQQSQHKTVGLDSFLRNSTKQESVAKSTEDKTLLNVDPKQDGRLKTKGHQASPWGDPKAKDVTSRDFPWSHLHFLFTNGRSRTAFSYDAPGFKK